MLRLTNSNDAIRAKEIAAPEITRRNNPRCGNLSDHVPPNDLCIRIHAHPNAIRVFGSSCLGHLFATFLPDSHGDEQPNNSEDNQNDNDNTNDDANGDTTLFPANTR